VLELKAVDADGLFWIRGILRRFAAAVQCVWPAVTLVEQKTNECRSITSLN
jgi:hypothetical protein